MLEQAQKAFANTDIALFAAAVADFRPKAPSTEKIKREHLTAPFVIELEANPDIAATLGAHKDSHQIVGGFALETEVNIEEARHKMERKNLDFIVLNSLSEQGSGFGVDTNRIRIISKKEEPDVYPLADKHEVARYIVDHIVERMGI